MKIKQCLKPSLSLGSLASSLTLLLLFQWTGWAQTLTHRYSFYAEPDSSLTATDTVAQANGTLNPNGGNATIASGQLLLNGTGGSYVKLPAGIVTNDLAVTVETWGDFPDASQGMQNMWANLFDFGQQDSGGADSYSISFCVNAGYSGTFLGQCAAGISDYDNANVNRENLVPVGTPLNGLTAAQVVVVFNPPQHYEAIYVNGVQVARGPINSTITPGIKDVSNKIGADNWADQPMVGNLDEFRIYNGALSGLQVAANYQAGWAVTNASPGTITNIQLQVTYYQMVLGGIQNALVIGQIDNLTNKSLDVTAFCTFSSSNTNVVAVLNNVITALGEGSATVTAQCGTTTSSQTITVIPPVSTLAHRFSFFKAADGSSTVADSIALDTCALNGTAQISAGQLVLDGTTDSYANLPGGIIDSNYTAVTIDTWASFSNSLPVGMFFSFGDTDAGGAGEDYIFYAANNGRAAISAVDPGWEGEQVAAASGLAGLMNVHITVVFNPPGGYIAIYTNGLLQGAVTGVTDPLSAVNDVESYIGHSLYVSDGGTPCEVSEFRIFKGALTSQEVALDESAGMQGIPSIVTNGPGTLRSITFNAPATVPIFGSGHVKLLLNYASLTNWDLLANSVAPPAGLVVFTSNTNILTYGAGGLLTARAIGTATLTVIYQGTTNTATIAVVNPPVPILTHRYSFWNEPDGSLMATDTVAQANGVLNPSGSGDATITGGQLLLDGTGGTYVQLPAGVITNDLAVSIEVWGTYPDASVVGSQNTWANLFDFGQQDNTGADSYSISFCVDVGGSSGLCAAGISDYDNANVNRENLYPPGTPLNGQTNAQLVVVFNPPSGYSAIYVNGALIAQRSIVSTITPGVIDADNKIGADNWADQPMIGQVAEFRIYNGVLAPAEVSQSYASGPTNLPAFLIARPTISAIVSGKNLILSWSASATGFAVQSASTLTSPNWIALSGTPTVVGGNYQVSVPISGNAIFFRLAK